MMDEVEREREQAVKEESMREEYAKLGEVVNFDPMAEDEDGVVMGSKVEKELWVDKYRPRLYMDLVGDEVWLDFRIGVDDWECC